MFLRVMLMVFLFTACSAPSKTERSPQSYRAMVYSQAFAEQFGFDKKGIQPLSPGVQAMVIRVIERPHEPPNTVMDLYLDDTLDVDYPDGSEGVAHPDDDVDPTFFIHRAKAFVPSDERWMKRRVSFQKIACKESSKDCFIMQGSPRAYSRRLMPGIAFITISIPCTEIEPNSGPWEAVVLRAGKPSDALNIPNNDGSSVHRFEVPKALIDHVSFRIAQAARVYEKPLPPEPPRGVFVVPDKDNP